MRLVSRRIGSRKSQTSIYWNEDGSNIQVVCGCYRGNLQEFKDRVMSVHGENEFAMQYLKLIRQVDMLVSD